jgi:5-hydroxyisourate hydrolase
MSGRLTTHVLDLARGTPAHGMRIQLFRYAEGGRAALLKDASTNEDGRVGSPLLEGGDWQPGEYELVFWVGDYFAGVLGPEPEEGNGAFLDRVPVRFRLGDAGHYHVPLLAAPGGYSTYRGS